MGFSCVGGEIPAALGRSARHVPDGGQVYVMIGDGTYLMGGTGELVTARQEGLKPTVLVVENGGYQSIHAPAAQPHRTKLRARVRAVDGDFVEVDFAANARSLGCATLPRGDARRSCAPCSTRRATEAGPVVIVVRGRAAPADARLRVLVGRGHRRGLGPARDREPAAEHMRGRALRRAGAAP